MITILPTDSQAQVSLGFYTLSFQSRELFSINAYEIKKRMRRDLFGLLKKR
jgi:hypothetical protein